MGEAAPAQPAVGGFVSMLGVGMLGSMPGRASGPLAASRGSAVPQLHSAIVERLRARIELCRRHHSTCESRYQRGQAETSDREHENTLHLLNLVHQSAGNRKIRGSRSVGQQSSGTDFNRLNSEQRTQNSETEPKAVSRNLVHGSLRRKIEGHPSGLKKNGITCGSSSSNSGGDFKRLRVDPAAASLQAGPSRLHNNHPAGPGSMGHHHHHHNHHHNNHHHHPLHPLMSHTLGSDLFNITLRDMKKEPVEMQTCGGHVSSADAVGMMGFDFKDEGGGGGGGGQIDPDLQELFDELTKSVPSLNDLELEKILKQDDTFNLGELGRPSSAGSTNNACHLLLDRPIKTEYSPDYGQVSKGSSSSQLRPASAGPSFSMDGPVQANHGQSSQGSAGLSRSVSGWPELSHAEQLKQMAANQQQPSVLLHHPQQNHQNQNHQVTSWPPLGLGNNSHSAGGGFPGENKLPGVGTGCSQPLAIKQNKGRSNCSFKRNGFNNSNNNYTDHKVLNSKPMLQFTPKVLGANRHQVPLMTLPQGKANSQQQQQQQQEHQSGGPQNKTSQHQNQSHGGLHFPNQQVGPMAGSQCLLPKGLTQRPGVNHPGPGIHNKDKASGAQDQFSHHLSRPPPDYEQARIAVGGQNSGIYAGLASSQTVAKRSPERSDIQTLPCPPLSNSQAPKLAPASSDTFPCRPDPHQGSCVQPCVGGPQLREQQQQQQHHYNNNGTNDSRMGGLHPNKLPPFQATNGGQTFPTNMQPRARTGVPPQHRLMGPAGLRGSPGGGGGSMESGGGLNWVQGHKQPGGGVDLKRAPGSVGSPSSQPELGVHHHRFQQTPSSIGPPNQVAPHGHGGMPPINSGNMRGPTTSRACPPHNSQPRMSAPPPSNTMNSGSGPESVCSGSPFPPPPNQNLRAYQQQTNSSNSRPGHGQHTFDFLPEGDNTVPGVNTDSDFIDSLLKSGTGNDDWMKDINLEEILGGSS